MNKGYSISPDVSSTYEAILSASGVRSGLDFIEADNENTLAEQIEITGIAAPTFHEQVRGAYFKKRLEQFSRRDRSEGEGSEWAVYGDRDFR